MHRRSTYNIHLTISSIPCLHMHSSRFSSILTNFDLRLNFITFINLPFFGDSKASCRLMVTGRGASSSSSFGSHRTERGPPKAVETGVMETGTSGPAICNKNIRNTYSVDRLFWFPHTISLFWYLNEFKRFIYRFN